MVLLLETGVRPIPKILNAPSGVPGVDLWYPLYLLDVHEAVEFILQIEAEKADINAEIASELLTIDAYLKFIPKIYPGYKKLTG